MTEFKTALTQFLHGQLDYAGLEAALRQTLQANPALAPRILQGLDQLFRASRLPPQVYISLKQCVTDAPPQQAPAQPQQNAPPPPPPTGGPQPVSPDSSGILDILQSPGDDSTLHGQGQPIPPATAAPGVPPTAAPVEPVQESPAPPVEAAAPEPQSAEPPPVEPAPPVETPPAVDEPPAADTTGTSSEILDILGPAGEAATSGPDFTQPPSAPDEADAGDEKTVFRQSAPPMSPAGQSTHSGVATGASQQTGSVTGATGTGQVATGPTGASIRTGTGSNWTDPSKWGEGAAPTMQPGSILKDRYVLETVIGRGGMGVVFKAKDLRREEAQDRNPHIAVKILNDEFRRHPESLKALQRESRKAQDLAHPNIVTVFDFDRDGQIVYMTMEFLEGQSLDRITKDAAFDGMPLKEAYPLIAGLGSALAYAHRKGVVHSDFKPANSFLTNEGVIKVFDFGIARAAKLPGQQSGEMTMFDPGSLGALTPAYASCEMIDGEEPDPRDDIYALACLSYELLTGKHPFNKRPASEARDKGLKVEPVKGLSRRNWRGLQKGLAFRREDRSSDIDEFLDDLKVRKLKRTTIAIGATAAAASVALAIFVGPGIYEDYRVNGMITSIVAAGDEQIPGLLQDLAGFGEEAQSRITVDGQVEDRLIDYYIGEIEAATDRLDYPRAETLLAEALTLYDDSLTLGNKRVEMETEKSELLAELDRAYNASLEAGNLMPSDGQDMIDVLDALERIDPSNEYLTDPQLATAYAGLAEDSLQSDLPQASAVVDTALARFPGDATLIGLRDRINTLIEVRDIGQRVAELEQQLAEVPSSASDPDEFSPFMDAIRELETLQPENQVAAGLRARLERSVTATVDAALADNNWPLARGTLNNYSAFLPQEYIATVRNRIDAADAAYADTVGSIVDAVANSVQAGDLDSAVNSLSELEDLNAGPGTVNQARDIISRGYITRAQAESSAQRFDAARELIAAGQSVNPAYSGWDAELAAIVRAEQLAGEILAEQERAQLEQERQQRIASLRNDIQTGLSSASFTIEQARDTLGSIDDLAREDSADPLAQTGRQEVAAKLATAARGLGARDQDYEGALALIDDSIALLPAEQSLRRAREELQSDFDGYLARIAEQEQQRLTASLTSLVDSPAFDSNWEAELRRVVQGLEALPGTSGQLSERQDIASLYTERAQSLRAEERFDLADRMLTSAAWFVPDFAPAAEERRLLDEERRTFQAEQQAAQRRARIDGLKRTFTTELNAGRIPDARQALATLRDLLPAGDSFISDEAPTAFAATYSSMAQQAFDEERFDTAEQLANEGIKEVSDHPGLLQLLTDIPVKRLEINLAEITDILNNADPVDSATPRNLLTSIRGDAGAGYADIEANLVGLADQRVASAKDQRDTVIAWLAGIFENYAAPALEGPPCTANLAGFGTRGRGQCFDYLPRSSEEGPRLIVIPAGGGVAQPFAIGRHEVSIGQWNAYCRLSGNCSPRSGENEQYPITNISVNDVQAYASWLSAGTNYTYRLPTAAEWQHAATATGSASISPNCVNPQAGRLGDSLSEYNGGGQNAWGMMNYIGNAQEWVSGSGGSYEARGGSFQDRLGACGIDTAKSHDGSADATTGFRLVRELGGGA